MEFSQLTPILAYLAKLDVDKISTERGCSFSFQSNITVHLEWEENSNTLSLYTPLCHPPLEDKAAFYAELLSQHLFGATTKETYFGLHKEHEEIMLFHTSTLNTLDEQAFYSLLETFVVQAEYWHHTLPQQQIGQSHKDLTYINMVK